MSAVSLKKIKKNKNKFSGKVQKDKSKKQNKFVSDTDSDDVTNEIQDFIHTLGIDKLEEDEKVVTDDVEIKPKAKLVKSKHSRVQHNEVTSTTQKVSDFISNHQPRKHLLIKPGKWYDNQFDSDPTTSDPMPNDICRRLEQFAQKLMEEEVSLYKSQQDKSKKSSSHWLKTVLTSGTSADKMAALIVLVQESPVHNLSSLESLVAMIQKKGARQGSLNVLESLKDLFLSDLLFDDRKLKTFDKQALSRLEELASGNKDSRDKRLILWYFEAQLKRKYANFVQTLDALSHDTIEAVKKKVTAVTYELLSSKPEQEQILLSMLVNKLGDPDYKVAATTGHSLTKLVEKHPNMKLVIVLEVERLLYRPNISTKAQYYGVCFLNQLMLSGDDSKLASRLLAVYFSFFKVYVKKGEIDSKLLSAILTGVNRAYPFAKVDREKVVEQTDTLYKIVHIANFNTSLQALMLLYQIIDFGDSMSDRYFMVLYRKLLDPSLQLSSKLAMFLNLLFKTLKKDEMDRRVQAFIKRLLQVCHYFSPPFVCGTLVLLSEVLKMRPNLLILNNVSQELDDEEEHFVDVDDDDDDGNSKGEAQDKKVFDLAKPAPTSSKTAPSWVHKANLNRKAGVYDSHHRNPLYCGADTECVWELLRLTKHYHPSVALFARSILEGESIQYSSDPLEDFTLIRFLDRFVYRNPKKSDGQKVTTQHAQAGVKRSHRSDDKSIRNIPVNSDAYLQKPEDQIPADEKFFYHYFSRQAVSAHRKEPQDVDSDAESVSDDEFDEYLDNFEKGLDDADDDIDFADEFGKGKSRKIKQNKKSKDSSSSEASGDDDGDLSDEEIDFGNDDNFKLQDSDEDTAGFNEEEVQFSDDDDTFATLPSKKKSLSRKGNESLFAAAEELAYLIDDNTGSKLDTIGTNAVACKDKADAKQINWEADRERWMNDKHWKQRKPANKRKANFLNKNNKRKRRN